MNTALRLACLAVGLGVCMVGCNWGTETKPATDLADVTSNAESTVSQLVQAVSALKTLRTEGTLTSTLRDPGGVKVREFQGTFQSLYAAPNQFHYEVPDLFLAGSNGRQLFAYNIKDKRYQRASPPDGSETIHNLPSQLENLLREQDPLLTLALSTSLDEGVETALRRNATRLERRDDLTIDGQPHPVLQATMANGAQVRYVLDPKTHLPRRVIREETLIGGLDGRSPDASARTIMEYTSVRPGVSVTDEDFAWTPPEGAEDMGDFGAERGEPDALVGQPAPNFTLERLSGGQVSLFSLKGRVVVLDFWATWCGPCIRALPHFAQLSQEMKGAEFFAVNSQEDRETVDDFIHRMELNVPVLLDTDGAANQVFNVTAIPHTVVIGKNGRVRKTFSGLPPEEFDQLRREVEAAMNE